MLLSDVSSLQRLGSRQTLGAAVKSMTTINDSEIERMYNISPVINDWSRSYQNDEELYTVDNEVRSILPPIILFRRNRQFFSDKQKGCKRC